MLAIEGWLSRSSDMDYVGAKQTRYQACTRFQTPQETAKSTPHISDSLLDDSRLLGIVLCVSSWVYSSDVALQ